MRPQDVDQYVGYYPETYPSLKCINGGVEVVLVNEEIMSYERSEISEKTITRVWGGTVIADTCKPNKYQWSLVLDLGISQSDKLISIYQKSNYARKSRPVGDYFVMLHDVCLPVIEPTYDRTAADNWLKTDNTVYKYFAVFSVIFNTFNYSPTIIGNRFEVELIEV